ncbi:MAG: formamidopyrimidine-DNA glycosylase, partial [Francisellaceae bacterium]
NSILGQKIECVNVYQPSLRYMIPEDFSSTLIGKRIINIERRGKYLLFQLDKGHIIAHLGMTGIFKVSSDNTPELEKHDHVQFNLESATLRYNDTRRFGFIIYTNENPKKHTLIKKLGPEPLTSAFTGEYLHSKLAKKSRAIKTLLMENSIVVGVGNIYANEVLHQCKIHPSSKALNLSLEQSDELVTSIKSILKKAIKQGGTTLKDFKNTSGKPGYFSQQLKVYGQKGEACQRCKGIIEVTTIGQRASFYCKDCQICY